MKKRNNNNSNNKKMLPTVKIMKLQFAVFIYSKQPMAQLHTS